MQSAVLAPAAEPFAVPTIPDPAEVLPPFPDPRENPNQEPEGPVAPPCEPIGSPLQKRRAEAGLRPGQLDLSAAEILNREKELSERRSYLQNFWYAAGK